MNEEKEVVETEVLESDLENEEKDEKEQSEVKKSQSREDNSKFAEIRRKNKELERLQKRNAELEQAIKDLRKNSIDKDTLDDLGFPNLNEENYETAKIYQDFKRNGSVNPKEDTYKTLYEKELAEKKKEQEKLAKRQEELKLIEEDKKRLFDTYKIEPKDVLEDKGFKKLYGDMINYGNLTELYSRYLSYKNEYAKPIREEQKSKGKLPSATPQEHQEKSYLNMSREERIKYLDAKYKR